MLPLHTLVLIPVGVAAGFLNVVAGGGSLLTMPTLIFLGLDAATANGSNRIALVGQNAMAMINFYRKGFRDLKLGLVLSLPAVIGAVAGAQIAIEIDDLLFRRILSVVMLLVLAGVLIKQKKRASQQAPEPQSEQLRLLPLQLVLFVLIGAYGGFIQAGVGYLLIFALSVVGNLSLVRTNSVKVIVVALYMVPSLAVFVVGEKVSWIPGLVLMVGNSVGGWLGSAFTIAKGDRWIRVVLAVAVTAMAAKLMGLF
jgi:uncharacterized membrane protein YfcA